MKAMLLLQNCHRCRARAKGPVLSWEICARAADLPIVWELLRLTMKIMTEWCGNAGTVLSSTQLSMNPEMAPASARLPEESRDIHRGAHVQESKTDGLSSQVAFGRSSSVPNYSSLQDGTLLDSESSAYQDFSNVPRVAEHSHSAR